MTKKTVAVRFTPDQYKVLQRRQGRLGYQKNEPFVRDAALGRFRRDDADGLPGLRHDMMALLNDTIDQVEDYEIRKCVLRAARRIERAVQTLEARYED